MIDLHASAGARPSLPRLDAGETRNQSPAMEFFRLVNQFNHLQCLAPIVPARPELLILGSLPGRKSLEMQQYYAHPQNAFWKLIAGIFGAGSSLPYEQKVKILTARHIALWDVLAAAERPGSLDSSIVHASAKANDFTSFYRAHPHIRRVLFNGRKAEELYGRLVLPGVSAEFADMRYTCMPSTSPAHAGMTFAEKLDSWRKEITS